MRSISILKKNCGNCRIFVNADAICTSSVLRQFMWYNKMKRRKNIMCDEIFNKKSRITRHKKERI